MERAVTLIAIATLGTTVTDIWNGHIRRSVLLKRRTWLLAWRTQSARTLLSAGMLMKKRESLTQRVVCRSIRPIMGFSLDGIQNLSKDLLLTTTMNKTANFVRAVLRFLSLRLQQYVLQLPASNTRKTQIWSSPINVIPPTKLNSVSSLSTFPQM